MLITAFRVGDLVEVETTSVRAKARVREVSEGGRLHIAFEMGEYFPWVDTDIMIRHFGNDPSRSSTARVLHAGSTTALLQLVVALAAPALGSASSARSPYDTMPLLDEELKH